jgi:hypothetical protein
MNVVVKRLSQLLRPSVADEVDDPARTLTIDLAVAALGFAVFGGAIAAGGGAVWNLIVAAKVAGAFLTAFLLCLPPLYALSKFFEVETPFANIVSVFGGHLALGGIFVATGAGLFLLLRRNEVDFDGMLAAGFIALAVIGVLICRARSSFKWLTPLPAALATVLFLALLCQSGWAFRPYLDPENPTLFHAKAEWFTGESRRDVERLVLLLGGQK